MIIVFEACISFTITIDINRQWYVQPPLSHMWYVNKTVLIEYLFKKRKKFLDGIDATFICHEFEFWLRIYIWFVKIFLSK